MSVPASSPKANPGPAVPSPSPAAAGQPVEADQEDVESGYGDETSSYTTSLSSSIMHYQYENGRRYHAYKEGSYPIPNDERERDRLDLTHHAITLRLGGKLHRAPIDKNVQRILDIGTGTGIWAIEMGDTYPSAEVIGTDLSPIQPRMVPPNVKFEVDDVEKPWVFGAPFDYIHSRFMAFSLFDWPKFVGQCYENTAPGGWSEFVDFDPRWYSDDGTLTEKDPLSKWATTLNAASMQSGREPIVGPQLKEWVDSAGFENVTHEVFKFPVGPWPKDKDLKEIGAYNRAQVYEGLEAFTMALFTRVLKWSREETEVFLVDVRKDLKNRNIHPIYDMHVVYGQKPGLLAATTT